MKISLTGLIRYKYQMIAGIGHASLLVQAQLWGLSWLVWVIFFGILIHNFAHSFYIHRVRCHKHFDVYKIVDVFGLFSFSLLNLGSPPVYIAVHRQHHMYSGTAKDPHNPYHCGFINAIFSLWGPEFMPNRQELRIQLKSPLNSLFHKYHLEIAFFGALFLPFLTVFGFWLSKIPVIVVHTKCLGAGKNKNEDTSRNIWWLKPLAWGEELHSNHHMYPQRANHNLNKTWKEFDLIYYFGKCFAKNIEAE